MRMISESLFYRYQRSLIIPAVDTTYDQEITTARELIKGERKITLQMQ